MNHGLTRREALRRAGAGIGAATVMSNSLIAKALAAAPSCGTLGDIEHVVILIQENRSFDHYFGSYRGVRGFADSNVEALGDGSGLSIFAQPGYAGGFDGGHLYPFHLDSYANGECTNDIDHSWGPQHSYWNDGKLDGFVTGDLAVDGASNGPLTMGYYTRNDLSFYYALADAFTICDRYFCSVIGPTDSNRLYSFSATLDPAGAGGGPILSTSSSAPTATSATASCRTSSSTRPTRASRRTRSRRASPARSRPMRRAGRCRRSRGCSRR
jgi:phospholipase C